MFKKKNNQPAEESGGDEDDEDDIDYVQFKGPIGGEPPDLSKFGKLTQAALIPTKDLVTDAILRRAELLRLEAKGSVAAIRIFVDGIGYPGGKMPARQAAAITQMLKVLAGLPPQAKGVELSGGLNAELDGVAYEVGVRIEPGSPVDKLTVRLTNVKQAPKKPDDLGISTTLRDRVRAFSFDRKKLLVVCGPPMSGLTMSTEGILGSIDYYIQSIFTLVPLQRANPMMSDFPPNDGEELDATIARSLRREPDVLYIGEIEGPEKLGPVFEHADSVAFVGEITARDAVHGLNRLVEWAGGADPVAEHVAAAVGVKLVRKLCTACRMAFRPNPKVLAKVGLPKETKTLYRAGVPAEDEDPCEECGGTGYLGRIGIFEFLPVNEAAAETLRAGGPAGQIRAAAKAEGMPTFQSEGLRLVVEGVTSLEELQRVFRG